MRIKRLKLVVNELYTLLDDLDRLSETNSPNLPFPPASERDIAKREKSLGFSFPPSYRALLKLHNGWMNFRFSWCLFGVSKQGFTKPQKELQSDLQMFEKEFKSNGPDFVADLVSREKANPEVIYISHHPAVAANFNCSYLVFDRNRPTQRGEYEIARVDNGQFVDKRYQDVTEVLSDAVTAARKEILSYRGDPETAGKVVSDKSKAVNKVTSKSKKTAKKKTAKKKAAKKNTKKKK